MEIGSAYALQVCLLQIPAMVAFSAWYDPVNMGEVAKTFTYVSSGFLFVSSAADNCPVDHQTHLPALGRHHANPFHVLDDIYLYRGEEQLPPW